jgi:hypothetical protein
MPTILDELSRLIAESEECRLEMLRRALGSGAKITYQDDDSIVLTYPEATPKKREET